MSDLSIFNVELRLCAIKELLKNHPDLLGKLLSSDGGSINLGATPDNLDCYDPDDVLVRLAWDIWNGTGETEFDKVLSVLQAEDFGSFIDAMKIFLQLQEKIHHAYATGSEND